MHLAYPGGNYDADSHAALTARNFLTARTTFQPTSNGENYYADDKLLYLKGGRTLSNTYLLATAKAYVDDAFNRGKVTTFFGHKITEGAASTSLEWSQSDLAELLDYVIAKGMPIVTPDDYYRLLSGSISVPIAF